MGFSPGKLLVFALFVAVIWIGFRFANRVDTIRRSVREEVKRRQQQTQRPPRLKAEDLVKCAVCGTYISASSAVACGRADCPWRR
jgi:ribosomal protein L32